MILRLFSGLLGIVAAFPTGAQGPPPHGDVLYRPQLRQPGKDVMWLPTPDALVVRMLRAAKTNANDLVYDLGAGDGKIPIAAAKLFGAKAVGIEYNAELASLAQRNAERAGVARDVKIIHGDIFKQDFSKATVVTMYLLPDLNQQLRPLLLKMKPGTRIVSHQWDMGEWEADETFTVEEHDAHLWIVPANVAGRWTLRATQGTWEAEMDLAQQFQRVGGTVTIRGRTQPVLSAYANGAYVGFTFIDSDGGVRSMRSRIDGNSLAGSVRFAGTLTPISGERR